MEKGLTRREAVRFLALAGLVAGIGTLPGCGPASDASKHPSALDNAAETPSFAENLTAQILGASQENCCLSPISVYLALGLLTAGATGVTRDELLAALQAEDAEELAKSCNDMMNELSSEIDEIDFKATLAFANSVWVSDDWKIGDDYAKIAKKSFKAEASAIDFTAPDASGKVSKWVSDHTNGLLKPEFQFTADTIMALINTIYFKDNWVNAFEEEATAEADFNAANGKVKADFMHASFEASYGTYKECTMADMYFLGTNTHMRLMLPWEGTDPAEMMSDPATVSALLNTSLDNAMVNWSVPKFTIESKFDLNETLQALGIEAAFGLSGDFADLAKPKAGDDVALGVSQVMQGTRIAIDENGAEAAAYTAIMVSKSAIIEPPEEVDFVLDRPFAYALLTYDNRPLFIGIVQDPSAK